MKRCKKKKRTFSFLGICWARQTLLLKNTTNAMFTNNVFCLYIVVVFTFRSFLFPLRSAKIFLQANNKHRANEVDSSLRMDRVSAFQSVSTSVSMSRCSCNWCHRLYLSRSKYGNWTMIGHPSYCVLRRELVRSPQLWDKGRSWPRTQRNGGIGCIQLLAQTIFRTAAESPCCDMY